jgi:moderate conductance mechanosensitive channel
MMRANAMRAIFLVPFFLVWGLGFHLACAQSVAIHQGKAAIIPGSPLAALTGLESIPGSADYRAGSPLANGNLDVSPTTLISTETTHTVRTFIQAVRRSTEFLTVSEWAISVHNIPSRRAHALEVAKGLAITILPAFAVEAIIRFGLARMRAVLSARMAEHSRMTVSASSEDIEDGRAGSGFEDTDKRPRRNFSFVAWGSRFIHGLLYLFLAILPIIGFAITAGVLLGAGLIATPQAKLSVIAVSNAYLFSRLTLEVARFVLAPREPALRLIAVTNFSTGKIMLWARIVLSTGMFGYAFISVCQVLSLDRGSAMVLTRLVVLAVHIEIAIIIWQSRRVVANWIGGNSVEHNAIAIIRRRVARIWHLVALFYVFALWIAWAGGVQYAFGILLRVVLVFLAALTVGRIGWVGSAYLLEWLFPDANESASSHRAFYARARVYSPLIRFFLRFVIIVAVPVAILQGWGMDVLPLLLGDRISRALISAFFTIVITVSISLTLWESLNAIIGWRINRLASAGRSRKAARLRTLLPMLRATIGMCIGLVAGLICLSAIGVNAAPLLAGASVIGIAVGFGSQKLVQDIITGLFLLLEDAIQAGDVINVAGMTGTVEKLSIRNIWLRDGDGSINIIPFSTVTTVTNMTRDFGYAQISIQIGYEEDLIRVYAVLTDIGRIMRAEPAWGAMMRDDLQIFGLDQFGASAIVITGQIRTGPGLHWAVRREFYARIKTRFQVEHIDMPYAYLAPAPPKPEILKQPKEIQADLISTAPVATELKRS